jgi:hypothetical protein
MQVPICMISTLWDGLAVKIFSCHLEIVVPVACMKWGSDGRLRFAVLSLATPEDIGLSPSGSPCLLRLTNGENFMFWATKVGCGSSQFFRNPTSL